MMLAENLLPSLMEDVDWKVAAATFGNSHSTLTGLLVQWWISLNRELHTALDGGPSYGGGKNTGLCDSIFCRDGVALGVLEVEGNWPTPTIEKVGGFFAPQYDELKPLRFAVVLLYGYEPTGKGVQRQVQPCFDNNSATGMAETVSGTHPDKHLYLLALDKEYKPNQQGLRARNVYYKCEPTMVKGRLYRGGELIASCPPRQLTNR